MRIVQYIGNKEHGKVDNILPSSDRFWSGPGAIQEVEEAVVNKYVTKHPTVWRDVTDYCAAHGGEPPALGEEAAPLAGSKSSRPAKASPSRKGTQKSGADGKGDAAGGKRAAKTVDLSDGKARLKAIVSAIQSLKPKDKASFGEGGNGSPKCDVLTDLVGFRVDITERDAAWKAFQEALAKGADGKGDEG